MLAIVSMAACDPGQGVDNSTPEQAFKSFWLSTDCGEIRSLIDDWDGLKKKMMSGDELLCNSYISLHQHIRDIRIVSTQKIADDKVRVKAELTVIGTYGHEVTDDQEDTFILKDGGWVLSH
jgi:hypothetical protein